MHVHMEMRVTFAYVNEDAGIHDDVAEMRSVADASGQLTEAHDYLFV